MDIQGIYIGDVTNPYLAADVDDSSAPKYYGFTRPDGSWYITKEEVVATVTTFRYVKGSGNYSTNWTNRAGLTYDYAHNIFDTV